MGDQKYSVTTADPSGYWLIPDGINDPAKWAHMNSADPVKEIDDLRARLAVAEKYIEWLNTWLVRHHGTCEPDALRAWGEIFAAIDGARGGR